MNRIRRLFLSAMIVAVIVAGAAASIYLFGTEPQLSGATSAHTPPESISLINEPIQPLPLSMNLDKRKVSLGKRLFHDTRLSRDNTIACASCHNLRLGGVDGQSKSVGIGGAVGEVNAPTVFNSGFNFRQFWDGRAKTLEEQIDGPIHHPSEMGSTWPEIIVKLQADAAYASAFTDIYSKEIDNIAIKDAIATFERSLITPNSSFDRFLRGEDSALTADEKQGYHLFKSYGCAACHQGVLLGGNLFEKFGAMNDYFADRGGVTRADFGRFNVTERESDRFKFRVPSLRNVSRTGPYFHDGSTKTLEKAVNVMAKYQLGRHLSSDDVDLIAQFLRTLTGKYEEENL
jgi:cytochrome c peroxidase